MRASSLSIDLHTSFASSILQNCRSSYGNPFSPLDFFYMFAEACRFCPVEMQRYKHLQVITSWVVDSDGNCRNWNSRFHVMFENTIAISTKEVQIRKLLEKLLKRERG
ncbi:hypothetical protein LXL04_037758 [Taraxacum kok-saghyz]